MRIISHRGLWCEPREKNGAVALRRSVDAGFGTETDVRDLAGTLVVSHDPATTGAVPWHDVVAMFDGTGLPLAVNVKADGLGPWLAEAFAGRDIEWFAFDMSGPQMVQFDRLGLPFYTRHSDVEPEPILYDAAAGVWLDSFSEGWFGAEEIAAHLTAGKRVCVVSPELHGREPEPVWGLLRDLSPGPGVTLCTDRSEAARDFFRT